MAIAQKDFENTIKKFHAIENTRGSLWGRARNLLLKGHEIEAYILILATWNFAGFRFFLRNFDLNKFENIIKKLNPIFNKLKNKTFEKVDLKNKNLQEDVKLIYEELKKIVKQTGASKIMALKNQKLFVMWDTEIRKIYRINNRATLDNYIEFLEKMKNEFKEIKYQNKKIPFAKAIDEYNYVKAEENKRNKRNKKK